jgi:hypothetical protein
MIYKVKLFFLIILSLNVYSDNSLLELKEQRLGPYHGFITCDELVKINYEKSYVDEWSKGLQSEVIPKCINDEFPLEWIESSIEIKKYGFTKCNQPPCDIFQLPLMGSSNGNDLKRIYGEQRIFLEKKIKTIENAGFYESTSPWYREWYSFTFENQTYYIYALNIDING